MDLTKEAAEGYDWQIKLTRGGIYGGDSEAMVMVACPYLNTSPSAMAWHLGRFLAQHDTTGFPRSKCPTPDADLTDAGRVAVMTSRGDTFVIRGRKQIEIGRYGWKANNTFRELA